MTAADPALTRARAHRVADVAADLEEERGQRVPHRDRPEVCPGVGVVDDPVERARHVAGRAWRVLPGAVEPPLHEPGEPVIRLELLAGPDHSAVAPVVGRLDPVAVPVALRAAELVVRLEVAAVHADVGAVEPDHPATVSDPR